MPFIEKALKNAYIGEYPLLLLSDVIAYYPMSWNLNDEWPHWYSLTQNNWTYSGTSYLTCTNLRWYNSSSSTYSTSASATISARMSPSNWTWRPLCLGSDTFSSWRWMLINPTAVIVVINSSWYATDSYSYSSWWHMYTWVFDYTNHTIKFYVDAVEVKSKSVPSWWLRWWNWIVLWAANNDGTDSLYSWDLWIVFATQNAMTQTQIAEFFNETKVQYWL